MTAPAKKARAQAPRPAQPDLLRPDVAPAELDAVPGDNIGLPPADADCEADTPEGRALVRLPTPDEDALLRPRAAPALLRMDRILMENPFFSLEKTNPPTARETHQIGDVQIIISPSSDGQATYWDLDILRYCISELNRQKEAGEPTSPTVVFVAHQLLKFAKRGTGKTGYSALLTSLRRLAGTRIETNIMSGGKRQITGFAWIERYDLLGDDDGEGGIKRLKGVSVKLSDWVYDGVIADSRVLSFSPEYFALTRGLERRLYDIARKFCGNQEAWPVGLHNLQQRVGSKAPVKRFRLELAKIAEADNLPDYSIQLIDQTPKAAPGKPQPRTNFNRIKVVFRRRNGVRPDQTDLAAAENVVRLAYKGDSSGKANALTFPESGSIRYGPWKAIAFDSLPRPTPDIDNVASRFRAWCATQGISLSGASIQKTFIGFCKGWSSNRA